MFRLKTSDEYLKCYWGTQQLLFINTSFLKIFFRVQKSLPFKNTNFKNVFHLINIVQVLKVYFTLENNSARGFLSMPFARSQVQLQDISLVPTFKFRWQCEVMRNDSMNEPSRNRTSWAIFLSLMIQRELTELSELPPWKMKLVLLWIVRVQIAVF